MGKFGNNHEEYFNKDGNEVPSVTTILKILNKPSLQRWANYLGFKRQDVVKVLDESAHIGTNTHEAMSAYFNGDKFSPDIKYEGEYQTVITNLNSFFEWINTREVKCVFSEAKFVGNKYGGTVDFYGSVDGLSTIVDFKTSKNFYPSMFLQLGAYTSLLEESGRTVEQVGILLVNSKMSFKTLTREEIQPYVDAYNKIADTYHTLFELDQISKNHKIKPIIEV